MAQRKSWFEKATTSTLARDTPLTRGRSSQHGLSHSVFVDGGDHHVVLCLGDEPDQVQGGDLTADLNLAQTVWTRQTCACLTRLIVPRKSQEAQSPDRLLKELEIEQSRCLSLRHRTTEGQTSLPAAAAGKTSVSRNSSPGLLTNQCL